MDKKSIIAVVICMGIILIWNPMLNLIWPPKAVEKSATPAGEIQKTTTDDGGNTQNVTPEKDTWTPKTPGQANDRSGKQSGAKSAPATTNLPIETSILENEYVKMELTNLGAGAQSITLKKHFNHHLDSDGTEPVVLQLGFRNAKGQLVPGFGIEKLGDIPVNAAYEVRAASDQVVFRITSASGIEVKKTFSLTNEAGYQPILLVEITNRSDKLVSLKDAMISLGVMTPSQKNEAGHYLAFDIFTAPDDIERENYDTVKKEPFRIEKPITWAANKNQFFTITLQPEEQQAPYLVAEKTYMSGDLHEFVSFLGLGSAVLAPGQSTTLHYTIYAGPKEFKRLYDLGNEKQRILAYEQFMFFPEIRLFGYFTQMLLAALVYINGFVHNFGLSIVIFTIIIKLILWYPNQLSTNSMKKMAALQPKVQALQEKYKDDKEKLSRELMKLYRDYKINPLGGCLPALMQIPIFIAFYTMLQSSIELRGAHFLWIKDLSQPDTIAHILGFPINPMPLIMAATMFWQMQMTPSTMDKMQKQIFMLMPVMFLFFCYNFSSGLSLYWTVQNLLTILQTWLSLRKGPVQLEKQTPTKI